jgi:hypothetical protein
VADVELLCGSGDLSSKLSLRYRAIEADDNLLCLMRAAIATERPEMAQARLFAGTKLRRG